MRQLKYDIKFNNIVDDIHIWTIDEIPQKVLDFIKNKSDLKIIYDIEDETCYCSKCFSKLSKRYYCSNCHKKLGDSKYDIDNVIDVSGIYNNNIGKDFYYYVFDIDNDKLLLYEIKETINLYLKPINRFKRSSLSINRVLLVDKEGLTNLITYDKYLYSDLDNQKDKIKNYGYDDEEISIIDFYTNNTGFLYIDNLKKLKKTIYKYTFIWDSIKYLKRESINLAQITYIPIFNPSFEYLIKYKLYNLAYNCELLEFKKNFKDTFGVEKSYLDFMIKNDINYDELEMLSYIKREDINLLRHSAIFIYKFKELSGDYNISINKIVDYFVRENIHSFDKLYDYGDYLKYCKELGFNLNDKKVLFPKDLMKEHDRLLKQYKIIFEPIIYNNIIKVGKILRINKYEDDNYIIYPAPSLESLIDESSNQNNCVRTYSETYSKGESCIYFMRKKSNINKSLVTIEVKDNKVVQARIKNNELPDYNLMNIINKWEKKLIPIEFDN